MAGNSPELSHGFLCELVFQISAAEKKLPHIDWYAKSRKPGVAKDSPRNVLKCSQILA
jgi:hypothetical protein